MQDFVSLDTLQASSVQPTGLPCEFPASVKQELIPRCLDLFLLVPVGLLLLKRNTVPCIQAHSDTRPSSMRCRRTVRILSWYLRGKLLQKAFERFFTWTPNSATMDRAHRTATSPVGRKRRMHVTKGRFQYLLRECPDASKCS